LKLADFFQQYFSTLINKIADTENVEEETVKRIFFQGFKLGYEFDYEISVNLNREIVTLKNKKRKMPELLEEFIACYISSHESQNQNSF